MSEYSFLLAIGLVFMLDTMSPGPSFILTAKTAVGKSRKEGFGVAIGLGGELYFSRSWRSMVSMRFWKQCRLYMVF